MSRAPFESEPSELLRRLGQEHLPADPADGSPARRERLVRAMRDQVEQQAERVERSRKWRKVGVGLAAAAAFLVLGGALYRERHRAGAESIAGLDSVTGTVVLTRDGARRVVSGSERSLHDGDGLQTATGAHFHLSTSKSSVNVSESTELKVSEPTSTEERISLRRGRVDVSVDKTVQVKRSVVIETPDAEVLVRGTVFDVWVEPRLGSTNTHVHVTRGSVWVLTQGVQVALLSAGQTWSSAAGVEPAEARVAPVLPTVATPAADLATSVAAPTPERAPAVGAGHPAQVVASAKDPAAHKSGTLAEENRLFAAGVEARNRGDSQRAAELFGELLSSYPQSTLREVAQVERFRALNGSGQKARAATEARKYLAEHPDGAARSEARDMALEPR